MNREQILKRMRELSEELKAENADIEKLETEYRDLSKALAAVSLQENITQSVKNGEETKSIDIVESNDAEKRGQDLIALRTITVDSGHIIIPKHTSSTISPAFNEVSTLIDNVAIVQLPGGESYSQPYIKGYGTGDYTNENDNYADAEPVFGYAEIGKTKITAYAETTEEIKKLPAANYDAMVQGGITKALRKTITREIMIGDGASGHFTGIFHNPADNAKRVINPDTDLSITAINDNTLDDIMFTYGGNEDVEDVAVLILSKKDLREFARVKGSDKKKLHDIKSNGNTGTIDGVPFIINSACKSISDSDTSPGEYCMAYGSLSNYQLVVFSGIDIQVSTDFKFRQGNIAHRGSVHMGGNVVAHNGFIRVSKGSA